MATPVYFLSYSRKNITQIKVVAETLMIHGIDVWQDVSNLGQGIAERRIQEAINKQTNGMVILITPQSVNSAFIRSVELPLADKRCKQDYDFQIVPIFCMPIDAADIALKECLTIPISNFNGVKFDGKDDERKEILWAAQRAVEIILENLKLQNNDPFVIGIASKQRVPGDVSLHLNFINYFVNGLPSTGVWAEQIATALKTVKSALVKRNILSLKLKTFCHLSLGCLFGYIFRRTTGYRLEIEQLSEGKLNIWSTQAKKERNPLQMVELPGEVGSKSLCVRINLMSSDDLSVKNYAKKNAMSFRAVLELSPASYPFKISDGEAATIAEDLSSKLKELHARYGTDTVHLFASIPLGLSILIGFNMNACGTIQCYEFDNGRREYFRSCTLC